MIQLGHFCRNILLFFKKLFKVNFLPEQTFLYAACGGLNLCFDLCLRFIFFHFVIYGKNVAIIGRIFSPEVASFLFAFCFSFPSGFFMSKYVVWTDSNLKGRKQLFRYFVVVALCFIINISLIKLFCHVFNFYYMLASLLAAVFVIITSYLLQRFFSFKVVEG
jgi:putative flippase GtrA